MKFNYFLMYLTTCLVTSYKIILIGIPGSGKTILGKRLSDLTGIKFYDINKKLSIRKSYIEELNYKSNEYTIQKSFIIDNKSKDAESIDFDEVIKKIGSDMIKTSSFNHLFINSTNSSINYNELNKRKRNLILEDIILGNENYIITANDKIIEDNIKLLEQVKNDNKIIWIKKNIENNKKLFPLFYEFLYKENIEKYKNLSNYEYNNNKTINYFPSWFFQID
jgi:adenylate kinase family enzyme